MTTDTTLKAKYLYASGHKLLLPKMGNAPMLLLEFLMHCRKERIAQGARFLYPIIIVHETTNEADEDFFYIRMEHASRETFADAIDYINGNL